MGRVTGYRHRATSEAASIKAKTLFCYLVSMIKSRHEVSYPEAELIATDALAYLKERHGLGNLGIIELPAIVFGEEAYFRRSREEQNEKLIELPLIEDDDADLLAEFGMRTLMINRMARVIEAAFYQGALLDYNRLCLLFPLNVTALRERLEILLLKGVKLPLAGTTQKTRQRFKAFRTTLALERYLNGEPLEQIRKTYALSRTSWHRCWDLFRVVATDKEQQVAAIAAKTGAPEALIVEYLALYQSLEQDEAMNKKAFEELKWPVESEESFASYSGFVKLLVDRHGYTPASAEDFTLQLAELAKEYGSKKERPQQVTYIAVADSEGAGVSLKEARLKAVNLDYITSEDWTGLNRESPKELKWRRIERFSVQAHVQGAALSLPDIAYLTSVSVDAVREAIKAHPQILLPTRGRVADMGTTLSHAPKIIDLFMYGYTESEIARRTGHSLESIERYLLDFGKVLILLESRMPAPAIRQVTGFSKKLTYKYIELYQKYDTGEYVFGMGKVRRLAQGRLEKKNQPESKVKETMTKGKGLHKYSTLTARELEAVQQSHMKEKFELSEQSVLAEKAVSVTNQALESYEREKGQVRLKPGQLISEHAGEQVVLPLIEQQWLVQLGSGMGLTEVKRQHEYDQYCQLLEADPAATYSSLWTMLGIGNSLRRAPKGYEFLPEEPGSASFKVSGRNPDDLGVTPAVVLKEATSVLVDHYGCRPGQAEAMVNAIAQVRAWCSPQLSELSSGQAVWLAYSTKSRKKGAPRLFVPVVLTLMTAEEQKLNISHYGEFKALKIGQIERITTEAWQQNAVLTSSDLEWLLGVNAAMLRNLLEAYQEKFGVVLPTAGTVLDMGRTLTHKKLVIEMSLSGMTTNEIASRVFHTAQAVDAYLKTFDKLLVLRYYQMPCSAIMRVLGHSRKLIEEHMAIADKHFPTKEELSNYLEGRGVALEQIC